MITRVEAAKLAQIKWLRNWRSVEIAEISDDGVNILSRILPKSTEMKKNYWGGEEVWRVKFTTEL
jgi:hypothetical protein